VGWTAGANRVHHTVMPYVAHVKEGSSTAPDNLGTLLLPHRSSPRKETFPWRLGCTVRVAAGEHGRRAGPVQRDLAQVADPRRQLQPHQVEQGEVDRVTLDQFFGLFRLLGHQFSPRMADLSDQRFWCMDRSPTTAP
jgi:hypothetical protein